jgi:3-phenylpropionate/trans-cinnamate dioxygenase ferredoxin reductase subunit
MEAQNETEHMRERLVVIGGGQAAVQAIHSLRQGNYAGSIALVGNEAHLPYQRPPLSKKYLSGALERERLHLRPESFFTAREVELRLGVRAEELDLKTGRVRLRDGQSLAYDRLLLATGSRPRRMTVPGEDFPGVHYVRTIDDVDAIRAALTPGARVVIVGAGYIGLEIASVMSELGFAVTVLEAAERVLSRVMCAETAQFFADYHAAHGVTIRCATQVAEIRGDDSVTAVVSAAGESFPCDIVIVGIGIVPNVELAERAGLPCDNGIRVDACARTRDPRIVAAGDCTNQPHPFVGRDVRLESVNNAIEQGKAAAASLLGQEQPFADVPWFWSDQYDLKLQIVGVAIDYDQVVQRGDMQTRSFAMYYLRQKRLVAIDAVNSPREFMQGKKLLANRVEVPVELLADVGADLARFGA